MPFLSPPTLQRSTGNPYPGLRPFEIEDRPWFFGREQQEQELLVRLDRSQIVTVIGGSGCGKSSLIRAGLLPQLANQGIPSAGRCWKPVVFVPGKTLDQQEGRSPLHNLARTFLLTLQQTPDASMMETVIDTFNQLDGFGRLVDAFGDQRQSGAGSEQVEPKYLFVIDQFEELFSEQVRQSIEARSLVARIEDAWRRPHPHVYIVITMRSEHLNDCTAYPDFPEVINDTSYLVRRLQDSELKDAIEGPVFTSCEQVALTHNLDELEPPTFELDLTELLLREVDALAHDPDHLPLFQHCLFWLWHTACEEMPTDTLLPVTLHRGHLARAIGLHDQGELPKCAGKVLETCLDYRAREAYGRLTDALQKKAERLFRVLATRDELQTYKRTPLALSRLNELGLTRDEYQNIEQDLQAPHPYLRETPNGEVDIYHEALIRKWCQFKEWIDHEWGRTNLYHEVCNQLTLWQSATGEERDDKLLTDRTAKDADRTGFADATMPALLLERLYDWKKNPCDVQNSCDLNMTQRDVGAFIQSSLKYHTEQKRQKEAEVAEKLAGARRRRKRVFVSLVAIALLSWTVVLIGFHLQKQALSRELAFRALLALKQDPARSAHVALAAIDQDPDNGAAKHALRQALATLEIAHTDKILPHSAPVTDARFSPDGTRIIVAGGDEVRIYDALTYAQENTAFPRKGVVQAWLNSDNSTLFTRTQNGPTGLFQYESIDSGTLRTFSCNGVDGKDTVFSVTSSANGKYIAVGCKLGEILVWNVQNPSEAPTYRFVQQPENAITALAFDPESQIVAAGDSLGDVYVWKLGQSQAWIGKGEIKHRNAVRELNFHPESSRLLVTASDDKKAIVWELDLEKRQVQRIDKGKSLGMWTLVHNRPVSSAKFTMRKGGTHPVVTVVDKTARIWVSEQSEEKQARGHDDWVRDANPSPDGEYLVTASADGTARIWSTRTAGTIAILRGHRSEVTRASFSSKGDSLLTASDDETVRIWRLKLPATLWSINGWVLSARFEPAGKHVAAAGESKQGEGGRAVLLPVPLPGQSRERTSEPDFLQEDPPPLYMVGDNLSRMSWSHDRKFLTGTQTPQGIHGTFRLILWDTKTRRIRKLQEFEDIVLAQFSQGTDKLATVGINMPVIVWDAQSLDSPLGPKKIIKFDIEGYVSCIAISPDGNWVAACQGRSIILRRCCASDAPVLRLEGHLGEVNSIEFSSDSQSLVSTSRDQTVRVWTVMNQSIPKTLTGHTASVAHASFDQSAKQVVSASADGTIRVWDVATEEELACLPWHGEGVNEVSFSKDRRILSASDDGSVKVGTCETCNLSINDLSPRVGQYAQLTREGHQWVKAATTVKVEWLQGLLDRFGN